MNKATQKSLERIRVAIGIIETLVPLEELYVSMPRKKRLENAYGSLSLHADKLNIPLPGLSTWYNPKEYLEQAHYVSKEIQKHDDTKKVEEKQ